MDPLFKTPSKESSSPIFHSNSCSPFTPKKSLVKRKVGVSRILQFDSSDTASNSSTDVKLEFTDLSQTKSTTHTNNNDLMCVTPVKELSEQNKILLSPSIRNRPNRFNLDQEVKESVKPSPRKRSGQNISTPSKRVKFNPEKNRKIKEYFKPVQNGPDLLMNSSQEAYKNPSTSSLAQVSNKSSKSSLGTISESVKTVFVCQESYVISQNVSVSNVMDKTQSQQCKENLNLNKKIIKSPKTNISITPSPNKKTEHLNNVIVNNNEMTPTKSIDNSSTMSRSPSIHELLTKPVVISGGDTYSRFMKFLLYRPEVFFLVERNLEKIKECSDDELKLYGRLLLRKHGWIRFNSLDGLMKYKDKKICSNFDQVLKLLEERQIINTDLKSCELNDLLNMLKVNELKELKTIFNITLNSNNNKPNIVKAFMDFVKNQRTFYGNSIDNLKKRIINKLGYCLRLSDEPREDVMSCLIYASYPYFIGEEKDRLQDCFSKFSMVEKEELKFPNFHMQNVSINFITRENLESYRIALYYRQQVHSLIEQKNQVEGIKVLITVYEKLKCEVEDKSVMELYTKLPTYMRKFTAASVYAYTLFKNVTQLKKSTINTDLAKDVLQYLLEKKEFLISKRPDLYVELAKLYEKQYKQLDQAAIVIIKGLEDEIIGEFGRQILSTKVAMYAKRKTGLSQQAKTQLQNVTKIEDKKLPEITINGKIISNNESGVTGHKQVYAKKVKDGTLYMSVEELALSHYKSLGYTQGIHDEGQLVKSMFFLCFWDIIYGCYPPHIIFISKFQDCPLDWRTRHFYTIREKAIKDLTAKLKAMSVDEIYEMLKELCEKYFNVQSVVNWKIMCKETLPK
ncbi:fanconi-associated nuclease 1-like isoform X2 [Adelges cooleyi]|nr:fanconi-associated nuclease 1-like isoform X2 [Adelges cooleyi]